MQQFALSLSFDRALTHALTHCVLRAVCSALHSGHNEVKVLLKFSTTLCKTIFILFFLFYFILFLLINFQCFFYFNNHSIIITNFTHCALLCLWFLRLFDLFSGKLLQPLPFACLPFFLYLYPLPSLLFTCRRRRLCVALFIFGFQRCLIGFFSHF